MLVLTGREHQPGRSPTGGVTTHSPVIATVPKAVAGGACTSLVALDALERSTGVDLALRYLDELARRFR